MSKNAPITLHIEWTADWVRAVDIANGQTAEAGSIDKLGSILVGHREALVGVSRKNVFLKTMRLPKAAAQDLRQVLSVQLGQVFSLPMDQLAFDFVQTADVNVEGCLTLVAAIRADELRRIRTDLQQVGIKGRVLPIAMAAPAVAARTSLTDAVVAERTIDERGGSNKAAPVAFDVVQKGVLRLSRVAIGSDLDAELKRTLAAAQAPDLKVVAAEDVPLPQAIRAAGGALALLHEAPEFGFELAEDRANAAARNQSHRLQSAGLLLAAAVLLVALVWVNHQDAMASIQAKQAAWSRSLAKSNAEVSDLTTNAQQAANIEGDVSKAFTPGQTLSDTIGVVGDLLPKGAWLNAINADRGKPVDIRGAAMTSDQVGQFVKALGSNNPRFRDVRLAFANGATMGKYPVVQFEITAFAVGNLPLPTPPKTNGSSATKKTQ